jgi:hypothetical protein
MQLQWRYKVLVIRELALCEAKLNSEGEKGWELVAFSTEGSVGRAFFKRIDDGTHPGDHHDEHHDEHPAEPVAAYPGDSSSAPHVEHSLDIGHMVVTRH